MGINVARNRGSAVLVWEGLTEKIGICCWPPQKFQYYWLVDPLDGTKEFLKRNGQFTVNIALMSGDSPVMGVVDVPVQVRDRGGKGGRCRGERGTGGRRARGRPRDCLVMGGESPVKGVVDVLVQVVVVKRAGGREEGDAPLSWAW